MKIGLVLPSMPGYSETFFRNKILGLKQNNFEVILFVNDSKVKNNYLDCKVIKAPKLRGNILMLIFNCLLQLLKMIFLHPKKSIQLYKLNKKDNLSNIHNIKQIIANQFLFSQKLDWLHFGFGTMVLGKENIAQVIGAKMAVSFRGFDIGIFPIKNPGCYNKLWRKVDKIHVISEDIKGLVIKNGFNQPEKIIKITPAIDTNLFLNSTKNEVISKLKINTIARLHWKKGLDYTLDALKSLKDKNIDFHYTIIGEGSEYEKLLFSTKQLGLTENVTFTGKMNALEVKKQLENCDIYLQYSLQEGFCNSVLEAQAMGLLCIVSDAEGLSENVLDGITGFVVPKRSPVLLANKIAEVSKMGVLEKELMSNKAKIRVQTEFTLSKQIEKFIAFYESH